MKSRGREIDTFITVRPESRHTALKKLVAADFSPNGALEYEHHVNHTVGELLKHLKANGPVVDLNEWLRYFSLDTSARIAFSEDLGAMAQRKDPDGTLKGGLVRFDHWYQWAALPSIEHLIFKNPVVIRFLLPTSQLAITAGQKLKMRLTKGEHAPQSDLLAKYLAASKKSPDIMDNTTVMGLVISTIHAGSDTVASATTLLLDSLARHPVKLEKLVRELQHANLSNPPRNSELNKLPYLEAAIKESMRCNLFTGLPPERIVPPQGAEIAGTWIPGGTTVSISNYVVNYDPAIWGEDCDQFNPDRWIEATEVQRRGMERASQPFSAGKRVCLGQHIAWLEMRKVIAQLVLTFKVSEESRLRVHCCSNRLLQD